MINAGMHDKIGGSFDGIVGTLGGHVGRGSWDIEHAHRYEKTTDKEYNTQKQEKRFDGNIKNFSENAFQYRKRFHKNSCCGIVKATEKNLVEDKARLIEKDGVQYVDNMVKWESAGNTVYICAECGFIDESRSQVKPEEKKATSMISGIDRAIFGKELGLSQEEIEKIFAENSRTKEGKKAAIKASELQDEDREPTPEELEAALEELGEIGL